MTNYFIYKIFISDVFFLNVSRDNYPQRVFNSLRRNSEYKSRFGNETATIAFLHQIEVNSLFEAKLQKELYGKTHEEFIKSVKTSSTKNACELTQKYTRKKFVSNVPELRTKIKSGEITLENIKDLIEYNESVKKQDKPSFDRKLLTEQEIENCRVKYANLNPKTTPTVEDIYYCDDCQIFCNQSNARYRHFQTVGHREKIKEVLVVD